MKCPKCDTEIFDDMNKCPNCGASISFDDDFNIDLPSMKKDVVEDVYSDQISFKDEEPTSEYSLDFTADEEEVQPAATTEEVNSVIDDYDDKIAAVDKEIEKVQSTSELEDTFNFHPEDLDIEEDDKEVSSPTVNDLLEYEPDLPEETETPEEETVRTKKNYLLICGAIAILIIALSILGINTYRKSSISKYDVKSELSKSLDRYYNTNGEAYDSLTKVLENVYKEQSKLDSAREETYQRVDSWIKEYINVDAPTAAEFSNTTIKYKTLVDNLYNKVEVNKVKLLEDDKYKEYSDKIDAISQDSKIYYRALDAFNKSDYNEAYALFDKIEETNNYYEKAKVYKTKIVNTVLSFIKKEAIRFDESTEGKTNEEKIATYKQLVDVIQKYDKTYNNLKLSSNETYQEYLTTYRSRITELSA